jgi:hypothetical protein
MDAVYNESNANAAGYQYYTRTIADPGGENQVIMFKSCFPNSDLGGNPNDPPSAGNDLTVGAAKYVYNQLLEYFASRPDKLFILITSPPMQYIEEPENARALSDWLVNDWLTENNYPHNNVAVFDFYNVLTHPDNHHHYHNGEIQHLTSAGSNTLYYDSNGDDHPNALGGQKATDEFIPLLNIFVNRWQADAPQTAPPPEPVQEATPETQAPQTAPSSAAMIDDFESGPVPDADYWVTYRDEAVSTTIQCATTTDRAYQGTRSLQIDFNVLPESWASCELLHHTPNNWSSEGLQFYLQSSQAGLPFGLLFYYQLGNERATSLIEFETSPESVGGWELITIPWGEFAQQDSMVYPESGLGMAFAFSEDSDGEGNSGTIWLDDISIYTTVPGPVVQEDDASPPEVDDQPANEEDQAETTENSQESPGGGLPFCKNAPFAMLFIAFAWVSRKNRQVLN